MAYISEYISDADKTQIGFTRLTAHNWKIRPDSPHRWVIDRETGDWLFRDRSGGEDDSLIESFVFCWAGNVVRIQGDWKPVTRDGQNLSGFQLTAKPAISVPEHQKAEFFAQLLAALTAHAHFTNPTSRVAIFNFSAGQ